MLVVLLFIALGAGLSFYRATLHGINRSVVIGPLSSVVLLIPLTCLCWYIPRRVEFDFANGRMHARYFLRLKRDIPLSDIENIVLRTNSWQKDPSMLLTFRGDKKFLLLGESRDERIEQVAALLRTTIDK